MYTMKLPDGPGYSPDGGRFWVKGNFLYWSDGTIWDMRDEHIFRWMPAEHTDDYSLWTDDQRAVAQDKANALHLEDLELDKQRQVLRASAMAKLTPEEREACDLEDDAAIDEH